MFGAFQDSCLTLTTRTLCNKHELYNVGAAEAPMLNFVVLCDDYTDDCVLGSNLIILEVSSSKISRFFNTCLAGLRNYNYQFRPKYVVRKYSICRSLAAQNQDD